MYENLQLFDGLSASEIHALNSVSKHYAKGEEIVREGDSVKYFGLVVSGEVEVFSCDIYGNKNIVVHGNSGFLFGEALAVLGLESFPVSVVATRDCEVLFIPSDVVERNAKILCNLAKVMAHTNIEYRQKITLLSQRSTRSKVLYYLSCEAKKNKCRSFTIPFNRQGLADYIGVERSAMSAEIGKLVREGIIKTDRNWFQLIGAEDD